MKKPSIDPCAAILSGAVVTGEVVLKAGSSVWYNAVLRGDCAPIIIGANSNIQECCVLHVDEDCPLTLGQGVTIGHGAILHGCTIGDNTLVGMGAVVLNGAVIGENCIVGAGALVTQNMNVPSGSLVLGSPAKVKRPLTQEEIAENYDAARHYVNLTKEHGLS